MNQQRRMAGLAIASAAAALFVAGTPAIAAEGGTVKVKCYAANACKGQSECKTASSACQGHNSCKGQGFVMMTEKACLEHWGRS